MSFYKREDPDPEEWTPHHSDHKTHLCRECKTVLGHGEAQFFNGWSWCQEHYREVAALYMSGAPVEDEIDTFNRVRR